MVDSWTPLPSVDPKSLAIQVPYKKCMVPADNLYIYTLLYFKSSLVYLYQYNVNGLNSCYCALFKEHSGVHMQILCGISETAFETVLIAKV